MKTRKQIEDNLKHLRDLKQSVKDEELKKIVSASIGMLMWVLD